MGNSLQMAMFHGCTDVQKDQTDLHLDTIDQPIELHF